MARMDPELKEDITICSPETRQPAINPLRRVVPIVLARRIGRRIMRRQESVKSITSHRLRR